MTWTVKYSVKPSALSSAVLIEGLPGIGSVGKVVVDFLIDALKARKLASFSGIHFPHTVFVNEKNLIELPSIELYYAKCGKRDVLLLGGDAQPVSEEGCYAFSEKVLDVVETLGCKEIVTLGGIGLRSVPKNPAVYCTGTEKRVVREFVKGTHLKENLYGVVGPIIGVSGVLLGLAARRKIRAVSLLAETFGHPLYLGVASSREVINVLNKKFSLGVSSELLNEELGALETEFAKRKEFLQRSSKFGRAKRREETRYIG